MLPCYRQAGRCRGQASFSGFCATLTALMSHLKSCPGNHKLSASPLQHCGQRSSRPFSEVMMGFIGFIPFKHLSSSLCILMYSDHPVSWWTWDVVTVSTILKVPGNYSPVVFTPLPGVAPLPLLRVDSSSTWIPCNNNHILISYLILLL